MSNLELLAAETKSQRAVTVGVTVTLPFQPGETQEDPHELVGNSDQGERVSQANQSDCGAIDAKGAVEADSQRRVPSLPRWQGHRNHWSARRCHRLTAVFRFMLLVRLAAVRADRHRPGAIDGGVLSAEANQRAILADRDGGVPAAGAAAGIEPRPATIARGEKHGGRADRLCHPWRA